MNLHSLFESMSESWSQKYKDSINCSHPKGFSQKAHCAGKKKHNESVEMEMTCPDCGMCETHGNLNEIKKGQPDANGYTRCWPGKHAVGTKKGKNGGQVRNCVPNESVAEDQLDEISQDTARSYVQKAIQSKKDLTNQTYRKGADLDKLNKKIVNRQQGLNRAHTDKRYYKDEQGVAEGFSNSSKDYGTDEVTITFDGDIPSKEEIIQYCKKNYGFIPLSIDIEPPSNYKGLENPGIIRVKQGVAEGKKPDSYHIVNKDGKPATLASYADRASAEKDRDAKHPGAEVRQLGPRGKVKNVSEAQTDYQKRRQRERDVDAGKPVKRQPKNPQNDYFARRKKERDLAEDQPVQLSPNISARPNQDPNSPEDWDYYYKDMHVAPGQDFHTQIKDQHLRQMDPAYNTMRNAFDNPTKPGPATPYKEPKGDTIIPSRPQEPEKMKDIEGNPVRLRDYVPGDPRISESRLYYNVIGTADKDLRVDFGMRKDRQGWYLKESSSVKYKMMAQRAFGSPKLQEYNFPAGQATKGSEGVISPVGSIPRNK